MNAIRKMTFVCAGATIVLNLAMLGFVLVRNRIQEQKTKHKKYQTQKVLYQQQKN